MAASNGYSCYSRQRWVFLLLATAASKPNTNIVFILTDDQDQVLGGSFPTTSGATPMPKTQKLLVDGGALFTSSFVHTPVCCPSRAETLTGRYLHNLKTPGVCTTPYDGFDPVTGGACCMHVEEDKVHDASFAAKLKRAGYVTGVFQRPAAVTIFQILTGKLKKRRHRRTW